jgi:hypothetical protein
MVCGRLRSGETTRKQRQQLLEEVQEIRQEVAEGAIKYSSVKDFLAELDA